MLVLPLETLKAALPSAAIRIQSEHPASVSVMRRQVFFLL